MGHRLDPIDPTAPGLPDQVFERIGAAIMDGRFAPGERLKDADLAHALGISRTPVREALQRLARIGMVEVAASRYTRVTAPSAEIIRQTLEYTGYQAGVAMQMAIPRLTDDGVAEAVALIDAVLVASDADDAVALYGTARHFFAHMTTATGNAVFQTMMREAGMTLERNLRSFRPMLGERDERHAAYLQLRAAVERRDAAAAEAIVRALHGLALPDDLGG